MYRKSHILITDDEIVTLGGFAHCVYIVSWLFSAGLGP